MAETFRCVVLTPQQPLVDREVVYASVPAWDGLIGVAPNRAPLLVRLGDGVLRLDAAEGEPEWFFIGSGFAQMLDNRLVILADEAIAAKEIEAEELRGKAGQWAAELAVGDEAVAARDRRANRARQLVRLAEAG